MATPEIEIILSSDGDYEKLTVEIHCDGKFVALLNQDAGLDSISIEFPPTELDEEFVLRKLDLAAFEDGLKKAKAKLTA